MADSTVTLIAGGRLAIAGSPDWGDNYCRTIAPMATTATDIDSPLTSEVDGMSCQITQFQI